MVHFIMSALAAAASAGGGSAPAAAPIYLVSEPVGDGVRLKVVAEPKTALSARYSLEVSSDAAGGSNKSTQSGNARLQPGEKVTLVTLALGDVSDGNWSARLRVEPDSAPAYEELKGSAGAE